MRYRLLMEMDTHRQRAAAYIREIKPQLSPRMFAPARSRLFWLPVHFIVIVSGTVGIGAEIVDLPYWLLLSVLIGASFAGLSFLGHEILHGAVVRGLRVRRALGWFAFLPFVISPRLWVAWHNGVHHGHPNHPGVDPDAFPTLDVYRRNWRVRYVTRWFSLGRGRVLGLATLVLGFSGQSSQMLLQARRWHLLAGQELARAWAESILGVLVWGALLVAIGPVHFLFAFLIPLLVANTIVMAFIVTNHAISPHSTVNDPIFTSLSVTVPGWVDWLTLRFGFHVEHHLFPSMSSRHAAEVRALILARWPGRYRSMRLLTALWTVFRTPRVYANDTLLVDPETNQCWSILDMSAPLARPGWR